MQLAINALVSKAKALVVLVDCGSSLLDTPGRFALQKGEGEGEGSHLRDYLCGTPRPLTLVLSPLPSGEARERTPVYSAVRQVPKHNGDCAGCLS